MLQNRLEVVQSKAAGNKVDSDATVSRSFAAAAETITNAQAALDDETLEEFEVCMDQGIRVACHRVVACCATSCTAGYL